MFERWLERLRLEVSGARVLADVAAIAQHHRIQASPGYDAAADWLTGELRAAGLLFEVERVPADGRTRYLGCPMPEGWACERAIATLHGTRGAEPLADFGREPLSLIQRSESGRGRHRLVAIDDGARAGDYADIDVRGAVVLTGGAVQRVHQLAVVERGAAGLLCDGRRLLPPVRTRDHDRDSIAYASFWWHADEPRGWGFVVSPAVGGQLRARLAAGEALELDVDLACRRFATEIPLVTAVLPGGAPGEILVTAHLCHPRPGANDNGSGVAAALEAARALVAIGGDRRAWRTIRFLWMPEFTGTYAWLGRDAGRAGRTAAALNLDMVGEDQSQCGSTQLVEMAPHFAGTFADELLGRIRDASLAGAGHGVVTARTAEVAYSGGSDHAVWQDPAVGVPCPMLIQWPDRYYHSNLDTPRRCDAGSLAHAALIAATYAASLASLDGEGLAALLDMAGRGARRRLFAALDLPAPGRAVRAELQRGQRALASVGRLVSGLPPESPTVRKLMRRLPEAADELESFHVTEIGDWYRRVRPAPRLDPRVPVRIQESPLVPMRGLQPGWEGWSAGEREAFVEFERGLPGGSTSIDLAWFACDGTRTIDDIAACLNDEGAAVGVAEVGRFFELTTSLGASAWRDAGGS